MKKIPIAILGATGMVGQKFVTLLANHPWFEIKTVAASSRSANKTYAEAIKGRWAQETPVPDHVAGLHVYEVETDIEKIAEQAVFVFCALSMDKAKIREIEEAYAAAGLPVVSNNSAHRWTDDIPMLLPEVNPGHLDLIEIQRKNRGWDKGLIVVKPNCSIQSYVPVLEAWKQFKPTQAVVSTYQAISGAGKTFETWPEMVDNVIPYIGGEEQKSEDEPMRIWGELKDGKIELAKTPVISANCIRVPVTDGHMALVNVSFENKPTKEDLIDAITNFKNPLGDLDLPSAPKPFIKYFEEDDRPQTKLDRDFENGQGITMGRLREDNVFDWKFAALSHNTIRGAAGGAVLTAELLYKKGYIS